MLQVPFLQILLSYFNSLNLITHKKSCCNICNNSIVFIYAVRLFDITSFLQIPLFLIASASVASALSLLTIKLLLVPFCLFARRSNVSLSASISYAVLAEGFAATFLNTTPLNCLLNSFTNFASDSVAIHVARDFASLSYTSRPAKSLLLCASIMS